LHGPSEDLDDLVPAELRTVELGLPSRSSRCWRRPVRCEGKIGVTPEALRAWAGGLRGDDQAALEATGDSDAIANLQDLADGPWVRTAAV
jgi:hypothetical protein